MGRSNYALIRIHYMQKVIASLAAVVVLFSAGTAFAQSYPYTYGSGAYYPTYQQPTTVSYPSLNCVVLTRDLKFGSRGTDVRSLQSFLVSQNYPGGGSWMLTGYFGAATRAAVQTFQSSRNLYPSGIVDANTRGAIMNACSGYTNPSYPTYPTYPSYPTYPTYPTNPTYCTLQYPNYNCPTNTVSISYLSPSQGAVGTLVTVTGSGFSYSGNTVRFGNGVISNVSSFNGTSLTFTVPSYLSGYGSQVVTNGSYNVSVTNASGYSSNTLTFNVTGSNTYGTPSISSVNGPTSLNTNTNGTWTIVVNNPTNSYITTSVNWGDTGYGYVNAAAPQTTYQQGQSTQTFSHAYTNPGTYTVTFTVSNQNGQTNTSSATVTVSGTGAGSGQMLTVSPSYGNAPLFVTATMYFAGCNGGNYYLYYGDGNSEFVAVPADLCNATVTRTHTYTTNGTYQVTLRNSTNNNALATASLTVGSGNTTNTLTANPTYGAKPLNVVFSANPNNVVYSGGVIILFGDGQSATFCSANESCNQRTTSHTYYNAGTYYATLQGSNYGSLVNLGTATVTVTN